MNTSSPNSAFLTHSQRLPKAGIFYTLIFSVIAIFAWKLNVIPSGDVIVSGFEDSRLAGEITETVDRGDFGKSGYRTPFHWPILWAWLPIVMLSLAVSGKFMELIPPMIHWRFSRATVVDVLSTVSSVKIGRLLSRLLKCHISIK